MELNFNQIVSFTRDIFDGNLTVSRDHSLFRCKMCKFTSKFIAFQVKKISIIPYISIHSNLFKWLISKVRLFDRLFGFVYYAKFYGILDLFPNDTKEINQVLIVALKMHFLRCRVNHLIFFARGTIYFIFACSTFNVRSFSILYGQWTSIRRQKRFNNVLR